MTRPIHWAAEISPVTEVTLLGAADLEFWQKQLRPANLTPAAKEGRAQLMISAVAAKFKGIAFRELSISVLVSRHADGGSADGAFLVHAFNSSRLFACIERTFFHTPYFPAEVCVAGLPAASLEVRQQKQILLSASLAAAAERGGQHSSNEAFFGPLFLPSLALGAAATEKFFVARLTGAAQVLPFDPSRDTLTIDLTGPPALQWLIASGFAAGEWHIRAAGRHAKSRTYRRAARDPWQVE